MTGWLKKGYACAARVLTCLLLSSSGCAVTPGPESAAPSGDLRIVTWNVQALFDGTETGNEYDEYRTETGWAEEKYAARVTAISRAIGQIAEGPPDVLALEEIENPGIIETLARGTLSGQGYGWTFFSKNKGASLGIGVLSRFPFTETRVHGITWNQETAPRPVLELWIQPQDSPLVLFVCHWKSKLGGEDSTESLRRASARIILRRIGEIGAEHPDIPVIILGDLNENHDEFYRRNGQILSALMPDNPEAAAYIRNNGETAGEDFFILSEEKPPLAAHFDPPGRAFYSPWSRELRNGSYYYKNTWETMDHFLLPEQLFTHSGWDFSSCLVLDRAPFVNTRGVPDSYNPRTGQGLSDHLPLMLMLVLRK